MWGCSDEDAAKIKPLHRTIYDLGGYETTRCPNRLLDLFFVRRALVLYGEWKRGHLPQCGGLSAQTKLFRETMIALQLHEDQAAAWYEQQVEKRKPKSDRNA